MSWLMTGVQPNLDPRVRAISSQLARLRSRVNRQLVEDVLFGVLALTIGVGALGTLGALWLSAGQFAGLCAFLALVLAGGLAYALAYSVRGWATLTKAAQAADQRAGLKNRLATLLTAPKSAQRSSLWPFLIEDSHELRERFLPVRIAPWRVPKTFYALLLACLLASLAALGVKRERAQVRIAMALKPPPTLPEMSTLPETGAPQEAGQFTSGAEGNQESQGGVAVGHNSEETVDGESTGTTSSASPLSQEDLWSKLSQRADQLAQALQDKITGREPRREARAFEEANGRESALKRQRRESSQQASSELAQGARDDSGPASGSSSQTEAANQAAPPDSAARQVKPGSAAAQKGGTVASGANALTSDDMTYGQVGQGRAGERDRSGRPAGGAGHGSGSDPEHLFGQPLAPSASSRTFKITMQGNMSNNQVASNGEAYRPPRADIALNPHQEPDQPMYRPQIAPSDRDAIKRVFEP